MAMSSGRTTAGFGGLLVATVNTDDCPPAIAVGLKLELAPVSGLPQQSSKQGGGGPIGKDSNSEKNQNDGIRVGGGTPEAGGLTLIPLTLLAPLPIPKQEP